LPPAASASELHIDPLHGHPRTSASSVGTQEYAIAEAHDSKMADVQQPAAIIAYHCACAGDMKRTPITSLHQG